MFSPAVQRQGKLMNGEVAASKELGVLTHYQILLGAQPRRE